MSNSESTSVGTSPLDFCDRPLSPVLCSAKRNRPRSQLNKKNNSKPKVRVNLSEKFKSKSESCTLKTSSSTLPSSRIVSTATATERIKKLEQLEKDRRFYYEILSRPVNVITDLSKSDVASAKKYEFKKPGSPISALKIKRHKGNQDGTFSEKYSPDKKISPPEMETPVPPQDKNTSFEDAYISVLEAEDKKEFLHSLEQENFIKNNIRACELKIKECSSQKSQNNDEVPSQNLVESKGVETEDISEEVNNSIKRKRIKEGAVPDENDLQITKKPKQNMIRCIEDENRIEIALNNSISINIKCSNDQHFNIVNNKNVGTSKLDGVENSPPNQSKKSPKKSPKKCVNPKQVDLHKVQVMYESSTETETSPKKGKNDPKQKIIKGTTSNTLHVGFMTASRQKIILPEQALKQARRLKQEVETKSPSPKKRPVKIKSESGTLLEMPARALRSVISDMKECLNNFISSSPSSEKGSSIETKSEVIRVGSPTKSNKGPYWEPIGFKTASGKSKIMPEKLINKAKQLYRDVEQDLSRPKHSSDNTITLYKKDNQKEFTGFILASKKSPKISKNELVNAKLLLKDDDFSTTETSQNTIGSNISGITKISSLESQPKVCEEVFDKAMQLYDQIKDYHRTDDKMKDSKVLNEAVRFFESKVSCKTISTSSGFTSAAGTPKSMSSVDCKKYKDFFKEDSPSNSTFAKSTLEMRKTCSRKRLGMAGQTPISFCKEQLEKAKLLLDDGQNLSQESKVFKVDFKVGTPERNVRNMYSSTPIKSTITPNNPKTPKNDEDNTLVNSTLTPIKHIEEGSKISAECMGDSIVLVDRKDANPKDTHNELHLEYRKLKKKMEVICARWEALDKQLKTLEGKEEKLKRYRPGQLYSIKSDANRQDRIPLKSLKFSKRRTSKITPANALELNLVYKKNFEDCSPVVETTDGAIIIPTSDNLVGYPEFKNAFLSMPGVDPALLPNGWFDNHLKWIVWKLASYDEKFGDNYQTSLTAENIISQLKYRYDKELCNAKRPTLRQIFEKDEVPQKRMVLCVSDIFKVGQYYELELTDGWYSIRSIIDEPLTQQVSKGRIVIGTKLTVQSSVLLNCEGNYPLSAPDSVRLKINFNNSRLAPWYAKLGYQKNAYPFVSTLASVHPLGGVVGCLKLHVSRVYPLQYFETIGNSKIWRNEKAGQLMESDFENNYIKQMEQIQEKVLEELQSDDFSMIDLGDRLTPRLYEQFQNDPESCAENFTKEQMLKLIKFQEKLSRDREKEFSSRVSAKVKELKTNQTHIKSVMKILVLDASSAASTHKTLTIWEPTKMHLDSLKEGETFLFYNVASTKFGELSSCRNMFFERIKSEYQGPPRQTATIPDLLNNTKFTYNQFDLIAIIVKILINDLYQQVLVTDHSGKLLVIKIWKGPKYCSLLGGLSRGSVAFFSNLSYDPPLNGVAFADADNRSKISQNPFSKIQKESLDQFKMKIENLENLLQTCDINIEKYDELCDFKNYSDFNNDSTDEALSLICTQNLINN